MAIVFRAPTDFWKETAAVTGGAVVAGAAVGIAGLLGAPIEAAAGAAALLGGSVGAALTRPRADDSKTWLRAVVGVVGGAMAGLGFAALSWRFGLGLPGVVAGGALGGLALGALLGAEQVGPPQRWSQVSGLLGATVVGAVGAAGLENAARFAASEAAPVTLTTATLAGLLGLWIAAASGLRRLQQTKEPMLEKADQVLQHLADPVRTKVLEGLSTWVEIGTGVAKDESMGIETQAETRKQASVLLDALLETARTWGQIHHDIASPKVKAVDEKLLDLEKRQKETTDDVTRGHLTRALAALQAQKSAVDGLKIGMQRAEAAIDAQLALLERLRLAVAQHRVSDRERFNVELTAVAEQASRLSDDLDSLSAAVLEAETLTDRRTLADLERGARRSIHSVGPVVVTETLEQVDHIEQVEPVAVSRK